MQTALVTAIGSFSADIVIKGLRAQGYRVVGCDIYPREWVADALNVDAFHHAPYATDAAAYGSFVRELCEREGVTCILPLTDVEVDFYTAAPDDLLPATAKVCVSPRETIAVCRDKERMARFLATSRSGVAPIPTRPLAEALAEPFAGPVVAKPLDGRSSQGLMRIRTEAEWGQVALVDDPDRYIVQPLIEGPVITVDVVRAADGSRCVAVPREELLRTLNGAGTSVHVFADEALQASCCALADELGIVGCVNFEFIRGKDGAYHFLECNPRFSGGVEFSCIAAYDCVANHLRAFASEPIEELAPFKGCYIARKYEEYVTKVD